MVDFITESIAQQMQGLEADIRVLVAHPGYAGQHQFLDRFLRAQSAVYTRFEGRDLTRVQLHDQYLAARTAQENDKTPDRVEWLIFDECDRAAPDELGRFVEDVLAVADQGCVLLLTRSVPEYIYSNPVLRQQTRFIPSVSSLMLVDYAQQKPDKVLLEVRALGSGRVMLNGRLIDNWDGTLPRALFFYLVDRGMTTRSQIFDTFWPNLSVREATNVFHVTKRKISEVLGVDLTVYWSGFYHLSSDIQLSYDAVLFSEIITDSAVAPPEQAIPLFHNAIALYQGHFLTSMDMPWIQKRRNELTLSYSEILASLARALEQRGEKENALGLYVRASSINRQREDIARSLITLYAEMGMRVDAEAAYDRLAEELDQTLGVPPSKETQQLIAKIRDGVAPV